MAEDIAGRLADAMARVRRTRAVLGEVGMERVRQRDKHGDQDHLPDGTGPDVQWLQGTIPAALAEPLSDWFRARCIARSQSQGDGTVSFLDILLEEVAEAFAEDDPTRLRAELVQVAAVAVQWIEAIDARDQFSPEALAALRDRYDRFVQGLEADRG